MKPLIQESDVLKMFGIAIVKRYPELADKLLFETMNRELKETLIKILKDFGDTCYEDGWDDGKSN